MQKAHSLGSTHNQHGCDRQREARINGRNLRIVPQLNRAEEYTGHGRRAKPCRLRHVEEIVRDDCALCHRNFDDVCRSTGLCELFVGLLRHQRVDECGARAGQGARPGESTDGCHAHAGQQDNCQQNFPSRSHLPFFVCSKFI